MRIAKLAYALWISILVITSISCTSQPIKKEPAPQSLSEYILKVSPPTTEAQAKDFLKQYELALFSDLGNRYYLIQLTQSPGLESLRKLLVENHLQVWIQPNYKYKALSTPVRPESQQHEMLE